MDETKPKRKWTAQHTGIAAVLLGGGQIYGVSEYFYTRREAQIELQQIKHSAHEIAQDQKEIKRDIFLELKELNGKVGDMKMKLEIFLRAQKELRDQDRTLVYEEQKQGG